MIRFIGLFFLLGFALAPAFQKAILPGEKETGESSSSSNDLLHDILEKSAAYCDRLSRAALDFVCFEKIREEIYSYALPSSGRYVVVGEGEGPMSLEVRARRFTKTNNLIYDYQMIRQKGEMQESRTLIEENGVRKEEKNAPLKIKRFYSERPIFGPVGFLSKEWHDLYNYEIIDDDKVESRRAYVIEVRPKTPIENKPNYGKIWVDKEDSSILRIDVEQESLPGFEKIRQEAEKEKLTPHFKTTHIYGVEKNGLRFPSRTVFEEEYSRVKAGKFKVSKTTIRYENYRFFTVDTEVKY
jgi:hypothetical protein